jgi:protein tyrosine phosphatase (PTP) superfamily phosphohydrolase (DUF442 family)
MALEYIRNFMQATSKLATAGQPSKLQLREVAEEGFEAIINLGLPDLAYCLPDEADIVQSLGLEYHHLPVNFQAPQLENLRHFFSVMDAVKAKRVFVHCAANKRVSSFVALYGETKLDWSREKANAIIGQIWQPDEVWDSFIALARKELKLLNNCTASEQSPDTYASAEFASAAGPAAAPSVVCRLVPDLGG